MIQLCAYWNAQIVQQGGSLRTNVTEGLSKMTLDVIGLAGRLPVSVTPPLAHSHLRILQGFSYHFDALNPDLPPNELNRAFHEIFKTPPKLTIAAILGDAIPLRIFVRVFCVLSSLTLTDSLANTAGCACQESRRGACGHAAHREADPEREES